MKNLPNYLSAVRILLSPVFLIVFMLPVWTDGFFACGSVVLCWILMFFMDISDLLDGYTARRFGLVSDFGKMFDPYTDLFARLTYFLCFVGIGRLPVWMFAIIVYREISVTFTRMIMMKHGFAMGARMGGKIKEWVYAFAAISSLLAVSFERTDSCLGAVDAVWAVAMVFYVLSVVFTIITFFDYLLFLLKKLREGVDKN